MEHLIPIVPHPILLNTKHSELLLTSLYDLVIDEDATTTAPSSSAPRMSLPCRECLDTPGLNCIDKCAGDQFDRQRRRQEFDIHHQELRANADTPNVGALGFVPAELRTRVEAVYRQYINAELKYKVHSKMIHLAQQLQYFKNNSFQPTKKNSTVQQLLTREYQDFQLILDQIVNLCNLVEELSFKSKLM